MKSRLFFLTLAFTLAGCHSDPQPKLAGVREVTTVHLSDPRVQDNQFRAAILDAGPYRDCFLHGELEPNGTPGRREIDRQVLICAGKSANWFGTVIGGDGKEGIPGDDYSDLTLQF